MRSFASRHFLRFFAKMGKFVAAAPALAPGLFALAVASGPALFVAGSLLPTRVHADDLIAVLATDTVHQCSDIVCMDLSRWPDGKTVVSFSYLFTPGAETHADAWNIRTKNGGQIEICGSCSWTFSTKPGASYTFSAQGCLKGPYGSSCVPWLAFHYTAPKAAAAGPSVSDGPVKQVGKVKGGAPPLPICDAASQARARNSPAAPGLEAQCRAALAAGEDAVAVEKSPVPRF